jgi:hypothetical protein
MSAKSAAGHILIGEFSGIGQRLHSTGDGNFACRLRLSLAAPLTPRQFWELTPTRHGDVIPAHLNASEAGRRIDPFSSPVDACGSHRSGNRMEATRQARAELRGLCDQSLLPIEVFVDYSDGPPPGRGGGRLGNCHPRSIGIGPVFKLVSLGAVGGAELMNVARLPLVCELSCHGLLTAPTVACRLAFTKPQSSMRGRGPALQSSAFLRQRSSHPLAPRA